MAISNRYDFVVLYDVTMGNPNGDPDSGNCPRIDAETGYGYVTDVCIKRKIRNYVDLVYEGQPGMNIVIKGDKALNTKFAEVCEKSGFDEQVKAAKNDKKVKESATAEAMRFLLENYFDARTFGIVASTGDNPLGIVRGPVQITMSRSMSPINIADISITREGRTKEEDMEKSKKEMGRKAFVPYALYRCEGYIDALVAEKTYLTDEDVKILFEAIVNMFEHDHSAARGNMNVRKFIVFKHENKKGNARSGLLFDKIKVTEKKASPRQFADYEVTVERDMPEGVELIEYV